MNCNIAEFLFYKWAIIEKQITEEDFILFSNQKKIDLKMEFMDFIAFSINLKKEENYYGK